MAHQYKIGDKVRIRKREGKFEDYPCGFTDSMAEEEGKIFTIEKIEEWDSVGTANKDIFYNGDNHSYILERSDYMWHSSMFEPVIEKKNPEYALGCPIKVLEYSGIIGEATYFFVNFDTPTIDHGDVCSKIREKYSDFCEIAINMGAIAGINNEKFFPEFPTIKQLVAFVNKINELYSQKPSSESKQILTTTKTLNENEIKFQRAKASSKRGIVPTGRAICGRRCKTAIKCGHLSYTACYC